MLTGIGGAYCTEDAYSIGVLIKIGMLIKVNKFKGVAYNRGSAYILEGGHQIKSYRNCDLA